MSETRKKTVALREVVKEVLASIAPEGTAIYYGQAEKGAGHRYIVFTLDEVLREDERTTLELEVNVMDYGKDTATVENLADTIQTAFNKYVVINDNIGVYFYSDRRNSVEEEDRNILRRRLTFSAYLYER
jgi:hypothetical protein